ncbi:MFS transporter [Solicola sp. PLA-1-18]|uniref:MFS transporter n=1 Tax=Solicola sp. PLA-1-18 TaxID=3380532 RepID=UPI003B7624E5
MTTTTDPAPQLTSPLPAPGRRLGAVQLVAAVVDGVVLSSVVVHATVQLALAPTTTGRVLAAAAVVALLVAMPLGRLTDAIGPRRAAAWGGGLSSLALLGYALAGSGTWFAVAATLFVVAQAAAGSARQALAVAGVASSERLGVRATMHTLLNAGLGAGTVLGAVLVATASDPGVRGAYGVAAAVSLLAAVTVLGVPDAHDVGPSRRLDDGGLLLVLRDRRFATGAALASVVQLTMPILSVLLPVWVLGHTTAPTWAAGMALALNTVLVIAAQRSWTTRLVDARGTVRSAVLAAGAFVTAGVLLALTAAIETPVDAAAAVAVAVAVLTAGEVAGGAATWAVALGDVPAAAEGRYQSAFSMSATVARVLGPLLALPLVLDAAPVGWVVLAVLMAAACLAVAQMATRSTDERTDR